MSNETDLDWLARNVHVWREGANYVCVNHTDGGHVFHEHNRNCAIWFTKDQWLSRRAELQNKPSWNDAPEWASCIVQDKIGNWFFCSDTPNHNGREWDDEYVRKSLIANGGVVLGDWRDTLENRPEEFKPSIEDANRLAQEFNPFISIEDNQEQEMKQDNGWFERGELPPVGILCLYVVSDRLSVEVEITAHAKFGLCFVLVGTSGESYVSKTAELHRFRPICAERDVLADLIESHGQMSALIVADAIIAAGFKLEAK